MTNLLSGRERRPRREGGQALALFAALMGLLVIPLVALMLDGGLALTNRRLAQSAADMAAIAAAVSYSSSSGGTSGPVTASEIAAANGFAASYTGCDGTTHTNGVTVNRPPTSGAYFGNSGYVEVIVRSSMRTTVAAAIGQSCWGVEARAVARIAATVSGAAVLKPVMVALGTSCAKTNFQWNGHNVNVTGTVNSNGTIDIPGSGTVVGTMAYTLPCSFYNHGNPINMAQPASTLTADPFTYRMADFHCPSGAKPTNITFTGSVIPDGTYCAKDTITISSATTARVTLIADKIVFNAVGMTLTPYENGTLVWGTVACKSDGTSGGDAVTFKGQDVTWSGTVYAPCGAIKVTGKANTVVDGNLWANELALGGDNWTIRGLASSAGPAGASQPVQLSE